MCKMHGFDSVDISTPIYCLSMFSDEGGRPPPLFLPVHLDHLDDQLADQLAQEGGRGVGEEVDRP